MNYITARAVATAKYLIKRGLDPKDAIEITVSRYISNPKLDIKKLTNAIKKAIKSDVYYEEEEWENENI